MASTTDRLSGFPSCRLFALVDTTEQLQAALAGLGAHVDVAEVRVLSGEEGARALGLAGSRCERVRRLLRNGARHRSELLAHGAHLRRGGHVLVVRVRDAELCEQLARCLADDGAHGLLWFARFSVVDMTPRYRAVTTPAVLVRPGSAVLAPTVRVPATARREPQSVSLAA